MIDRYDPIGSATRAIEQSDRCRAEGREVCIDGYFAARWWETFGEVCVRALRAELVEKDELIAVLRGFRPTVRFHPNRLCPRCRAPQPCICGYVPNTFAGDNI